MAKKRPYKIGYVGLSETEVLVLKSLERILATRARPYEFEAAGDKDSDVYVIDAGDAGALQWWNSIREQTEAPVILVSETDLEGVFDYSIRRPLVAARVLAALDSVTGQKATFAPSAA